MFDEKQLIMENADLWKMAQQIKKKKKNLVHLA